MAARHFIPTLHVFSDLSVFVVLHYFSSYFEADILVWPSILSVKRQVFNLLKFILVWGRLKHGIDLRGALWSHEVQSVFHLHFRPSLTLYLKTFTPQILSISTKCSGLRFRCKWTIISWLGHMDILNLSALAWHIYGSLGAPASAMGHSPR